LLPRPTYVWNARDQLAQIKNAHDVVIASFTYDALGRRQTKTVGGIASGYVYDGANIVQELAGGASNNGNPANVKASYVSGGIDEVFAQQGNSAAGATTLTYLTDALGSTVRLIDAAGAKVVDYTYDPYGNTSTDAAVDNPFQYTGRENDGTGLYYYRASYYSTRMARFISSDPIGLAGGINTYGYVQGNPISLADPSGLASSNAGSAGREGPACSCKSFGERTWDRYRETSKTIDDAIDSVLPWPVNSATGVAGATGGGFAAKDYGGRTALQEGARLIGEYRSSKFSLFRSVGRPDFVRVGATSLTTVAAVATA
jgi:RHS repeat-associated protein